jgi:hypothetical protein
MYWLTTSMSPLDRLPDDVIQRIIDEFGPLRARPISLFSNVPFAAEYDPLDRFTLRSLCYVNKRLSIFAKSTLFSYPYLTETTYKGQVQSLERRLVTTDSATLVKSFNLCGSFAVPVSILRACTTLNTLKIACEAISPADIDILRIAVKSLECLSDLVLDFGDLHGSEAIIYARIVEGPRRLHSLRFENLDLSECTGQERERPLILKTHRLDFYDVIFPTSPEVFQALFEIPQDISTLLISTHITDVHQIHTMQTFTRSLAFLRDLHLQTFIHRSVKAIDASLAAVVPQSVQHLLLGNGCDHILRYPSLLPKILQKLEVDAPSNQMDRNQSYNFGPILETITLLYAVIKAGDCCPALKSLSFNARNWPFVAASGVSPCSFPPTLS